MTAVNDVCAAGRPLRFNLSLERTFNLMVGRMKMKRSAGGRETEKKIKAEFLWNFLKE